MEPPAFYPCRHLSRIFRELPGSDSRLQGHVKDHTVFNVSLPSNYDFVSTNSGGSVVGETTVHNNT